MTFSEFLTRRAEASDAYIRGDGAPLDAMLTRADPATFLPPGPPGTVIVGADDVRTEQIHGAAAFDARSTGTFEVLASGSSGEDDGAIGYLVARQVATVHWKDQDAPVEMTLRVSEVFRHEDGAWRLVHRHADAS